MRLASGFATTVAVTVLAVSGLLSVPAHADSPAPADREYGVTPGDREYGVTPADREYGIAPADREYGIAPADREYGIAPADFTAQSSGKQYCWETGYAECKARKNLYDYLGCTTSSIYPYPWYPNSYYFYYWC